MLNFVNIFVSLYKRFRLLLKFITNDKPRVQIHTENGIDIFGFIKELPSYYLVVHPHDFVK